MARRRRLSRALTGVAAVALVLAFGSPAHADDPPSGQFSGGAVSDSSAGFTGTSTSTSSTPSSSSGSSSTGSSSTGSSSTGSSSSGGSSTSSFPGLGTATGPGTGACDPAAYPGGYSSTLAVPSPCAPVEECGAYQGSTFVSEACPTDPAAPGPRRPPPPQITTAMVTEAARVTAPTNAPHVEPGTVSYVHIPNNYWTETATVNDAVTILGVNIPLRWTPTSTTWNFGDGGSGAGDGIQGADVGAPGAIEHAYTRRGSYDITTTTTYNLTFVLPGQGAQTIQLTAPPSPPATLPVQEIQTLVSYAR